MDVAHELAEEVVGCEGEPLKVLENTYFKDEPTLGQRGKGSPRIDVVFANPTAAVKDLTYRWDLVEEAHVPIQLTLDIDQINEDEVIQKFAGQVKAKEEVKDITCDTGEIFEEIETLHGNELQRQIASRDLNGAHITWHKMAEMCTMMIGGDTLEQANENVFKNWLRGTKPSFIRRQKTRLVDTNGNPVTHGKKAD